MRDISLTTIAGILLVLLTFFGLAPRLLESGIEQWHMRGDAKFYADCARNFLDEGRFRWNEVYPIALKKNQDFHMSWTAIAHPLMVASAMKVAGFTAPFAAIFCSVLSFLLTLICIAAFTFHLTRQFWPVIAALGLCFYFRESWEFASSGATESLSQLFLVMGFYLLWYFLEKNSIPRLCLLMSLALIGCLVRPHNQFFLIALCCVVIFLPKDMRLKYTLVWFSTLVLSFLIKKPFIIEGTITFPYLFSFLVATPAHPGHEIFREYLGAFGISDLWQQRDQLIPKASVGWRIMKMDWPGWLPQTGLLLVLVLISKQRALSLTALLVMIASLFFSAMGHIVTRYWNILEVIILVVAIAATFSQRPTGKLFKAGVLFFFLASMFLHASRWQFQWRNPSFEKSSPPEELLSHLPAKGLIACDKPSLLIESVSRPILLLPENTSYLDAITREVAPVVAIVLSHEIENGELKGWKDRHHGELTKSHRVHRHDGWTIYLK